MTSDCIYRDTLLKDIEENVVFSGQTPNAEIVGANKVISRIKAAHIADVAPVVHGQWIAVDSSYWRWTPSGGVPVAHITYRCDRCGRGSVTQSKYCPTCGARMDGECE